MRNYLVKINPKQWYDKLLDGSVFMRSAHIFAPDLLPILR